MRYLHTYKLFESKSPLTFKTKRDNEEETTTIKSYEDGEYVGKIIFGDMHDMFWYFEGDFTEDEYYKLFPDDEMVRIEDLEVEDEFKHKGYGKLLMDQALEEIHHKSDMKKIYLNACPIGTSGLPLKNLVKFYEKFGFVSIIDQSKNIQMIKDNK